jgi:hypothetical protein
MPCKCALIATTLLGLPGSGPHTIQYGYDSWANNSWGFHDVDRRQYRCTVATASDGAQSQIHEMYTWRFHIVPEEHYKYRTLYLPNLGTAYEIDDEKKIVYPVRCSCIWGYFAPPSKDPTCFSSTARPTASHEVGRGVIAGMPLITYRHQDDESSEVVSLAPSLGCAVFERFSTTYNSFRIPTSYSHLAITSYNGTQPPAETFVLPHGYAIQETRR